MDLEKIIFELNYPDIIKQAVQEKIYKDKKAIEEIANTAYDGENFAFQLCKRMPLTRLATVTYLLAFKYADYRSLSIPDEIIFDTFQDVSLRAKLYYEKTGKVGITKDDVIWFRHIMAVNIFKIGAIQFQPFGMLYLDEETLSEPYMAFSKKQKEILPNGTAVLNCHIQRGADLSPLSVEASFQEAKHFFLRTFPSVQYRAFLCYSWLLYPPMFKKLPENSHIKHFADNFLIIGHCHDTKQALENLFGQAKRVNVLPSNATSLQKLAVEHPESFGFGCGIILI